MTRGWLGDPKKEGVDLNILSNKHIHEKFDLQLSWRQEKMKRPNSIVRLYLVPALSHCPFLTKSTVPNRLYGTSLYIKSISGPFQTVKIFPVFHRNRIVSLWNVHKFSVKFLYSKRFLRPCYLRWNSANTLRKQWACRQGHEYMTSFVGTWE